MSEVGNPDLSKTEKLDKVLELIHQNAKAYEYFANGGRLLSEVRRGFDELAVLSDNKLVVETEIQGRSFIVRLLNRGKSNSNNYIYVDQSKVGSLLFKIRVLPGNETDGEEEYVLSLNSFEDAFVLKPQILNDENIIKSDLLLDSSFFENVMFDFLTAVHQRRQR